MQLNKLVLQHPLAMHGVLRRATAAESSLDVPFADQLVEELIVQ
jgi:hypothetical protein